VTTLAQRSFAGGELDPRLHPKCDLVKYQTGAATCRNGTIMRQGGFESRAGWRFVGEIVDSESVARLIPFFFNASQAYMLEFGNETMRVIKNGSYVTETAKVITAISQAAQAQVTIAAHGFSDGDELVLADIKGMTELNTRNVRVSDSAANTFKLKDLSGNYIDSTAFGAYVSGGTAARVYTLATNYQSADLPYLKRTQTADILKIVRDGFTPVDIRRTGDAAWTHNIQILLGLPEIDEPKLLTQVTYPSGTAAYWAVTALSQASGEESEISIFVDSNTAPSSTTQVTLSWTAPIIPASGYNIYRFNGVWAYIGTTTSTSFVDHGYPADTSITPPTLDAQRRPNVAGVANPTCIAYHGQRAYYSGRSDYPGFVWGSRIAQQRNFTASSPIKADDSILAPLFGPKVAEIRHMLSLGSLILFTARGAVALTGNGEGAITPTSINPKDCSSFGAAEMPEPIEIDGDAVFVEASGKNVHALGFQFEIDGYKGGELSIFASHLVDDHTIVDWAYQQKPHSILWAVRSDGTLLSMTYLKEQQIIGWARHDTDGEFENVAVVHEGNTDVLYAVVKRTINGETKRYVERLEDRQVTEETQADFAALDSCLTYDGRNTDESHTLTLQELDPDFTWGAGESVSILSSQAFFTAEDVGNEIHFEGADGFPVRVRITEYGSDDTVYGKPHRDVPTELRNTATSTWARAVDEVSGLWHLEGKEVAVYADGFVVSNPLTANEGQALTVSDGSISLTQPFSVITVGLPYIVDLETLDIDTPQGESLASKKKNVSSVIVHLHKTRGVYVGPKAPSDDDEDPLEHLSEVKLRENESMEKPIELKTGQHEQIIESEWSSGGRVFLRQVDPLPMTILAVMPNLWV
jgi:hypothetical protein